MTSTAWLDIGILTSGLVLGGLINWITPPKKLSQKLLVMSICLALAIAAMLTVIKDNPGNSQHPIAALTCPRVFDKAHDLLVEQSGLAAPPLAGVAFTPSQGLPGRVDLTLTWINQVPVTQSAVGIEGVYGQADPNDGFIDHTQPAAATGECWNWYHFGPRDDAQPETVRLQVSGLWPEQQYCFYTVFRIDTGYSKPTAIRCLTATWKPEWGTPAQAPQK
ncbi:MAG TPA: hypothetical protein VHX38_31815 [Pseudonocardiaceae bacterium]|nr:hypothetical protein [Pseudonocardiaceae bacterium]